ncbi:MAG: multidrug ABC transporter permease [Burkholderiales bacterium]|nr:multidrug ABC transporter permease [Burkholderiales bacterium]
MIQLLKLITISIVFLLVLIFTRTILLITAGFEVWINTAVSLSLAALASWYSWRWFSGKKIGIAAAVLSGSLILGGFGFVFGFFGLMLITRDTQQAATIGIFIASPLGMLLGAVAGYILVSGQKQSISR